MRLEGKEILITGGCGFIGSHLVDALIKRRNKVTVVDNLTSSTTKYIEGYIAKKVSFFNFIRGDIRDFSLMKRLTKGKELIFHFAAQPDVRKSVSQVGEDFEVNVKAGVDLLRAIEENKVGAVIFASSAGTIYGDAPLLPTPEGFNLQPISHYGASKAAGEMYLSSFAHLLGIQATTLRYGNIFGPRSNHGVIYDFFHKLKRDSKSLEILGDGEQEKSYLYIDDCIEASLLAAENAPLGFKAYNISSSKMMKVKVIAKIVIEEMKLKGVKLRYTGGKRGWPGDVVKSFADTAQIQSLGFKPKVSMEEGIRRYIRWLGQWGQTPN